MVKDRDDYGYLLLRFIEKSKISDLSVTTEEFDCEVSWQSPYRQTKMSCNEAFLCFFINNRLLHMECLTNNVLVLKMRAMYVFFNLNQEGFDPQVISKGLNE